MNKKIKIIELLNKIANGEKKPEEIKYKDNIYTWLDYKYIDNQGYTFNIYSNRYDLDDEVEILEDNTEDIEELDKFDIQGLEVSGYSMTQAEYLLEDGIEENRNKINELVRKVNELNNKIKDI